MLVPGPHCPCQGSKVAAAAAAASPAASITACCYFYSCRGYSQALTLGMHRLEKHARGKLETITQTFIHHTSQYEHMQTKKNEKNYAPPTPRPPPLITELVSHFNIFVGNMRKTSSVEQKKTTKINTVSK